MINRTPVLFEFPDAESARKANETLKEFDYETQLTGEDACRLLFLHDSRHDLVSSLEIAQIHGGRLIEQEISVPAHLVNEDLPEAYLEGATDELLL